MDEVSQSLAAINMDEISQLPAASNMDRIPQLATASNMDQISQFPAESNMDGISQLPAASNMDRISQLPAAILDHILSLLPLEEAARMSGLSTTWENAYSSLSFLNFGDYFLDKPIEELLNVVDLILKNRQKKKKSVEKFSLQLSNQQWSSQVYNWINTLVDCNIEELNLGGRPSNGYEWFGTPVDWYIKVPDAIFDAKSLKVLKLSGFHIELPSNRTTIMFSSSLRELYLDNVLFDEEFMQALCTSCCNLEIFTVEFLNGLSSFQTCLPKLKRLEVTSYYSKLQLVDIRAPNIQELFIYCCILKKDPDVVIITDCCKSLKSLHLGGVAMTQKSFDEILPYFQNLEKLRLDKCDMLKNVKISSVLLKQLRVCYCDNVINVELNTPNLINFWYECGSLPTLKLEASASLEANILFDSEGGGDSDWYSKLMKFLDNFNHSRSLELICENEKGLVIPKDMREHLFPPLYGTNCVKVIISCLLIDCSVVDIVDAMLWLFPQLDALSYFQPGTLSCLQLDMKTLEFLYEDALGEDEKLCCTSQPWKCWRHKLKQVKIHNVTCPEQNQELRNYFYLHENTDILEIIEVPPVGIDPECPEA